MRRPTTLGEAQHGIQARDVYRHKPLPALETEQERQVLDEFRQLERVTNAHRKDIDDHTDAYNPHGKMNWRGDSWDGTEHYEDDVVRDGAWTMVANKTTTDRPAPQTVGDPAYTLPDLPVWSELSNNSVIYSGHLYTFTTNGYFRALRIWIPELLASTNYRTVIVSNPNSTNPSYTSIDEPVLTEDGWTLLTADTILVSAGEELLVYLDALNQGDSTTWQKPWTYDGPSQTGTPGPGLWNHDSQNTTLRINHVDGDTTSQRQTLRVIANTVFEISDLANPERYYHYRVTGQYTEQADHTTYPVTLFDTGAGGPTEGVGQNIRAIQPVPDPTKYVQIANYWATGEPSWATVQGFLQYDGADQPGHADTAFGIDIAFQQLAQSPDWDVLALSSEGGGNSGGGEFDGVHNDINGRDAADAHPLASITGLETDGAGTTYLNDQGLYSAPPSGGFDGVHNDLDGRTTANAHPMAAITGMQTGGAGTAYLNDQGQYTVPPGDGFDGNHNDLPGLTAPDAHPLASITGIQTGGAGEAWLDNRGLYTAPPTGFTGDHNDLPGLTASNAHPLASITGIQTGGAGDAWLDNRGQYSAPPSGGATEPYGYFYVPMHEFVINADTTPFKSPTLESFKGTNTGDELSYEMLRYPNDPTAVRATAVIPVPQDYALNGALKVRMVWWVSDGITHAGQKAAFYIKAATGGHQFALNELVFNETGHLLTVEGNYMMKTVTFSVIPYQNDFGASSPWNGQLLFLTASRWAGNSSDNLATDMGLASFYVQYPRVTTPSSVWT